MRKEFTKEQAKALSLNKSVLKYASNRVAFTEEFKVQALKRYAQGYTPMQIFLKAGLDIGLLGRGNPRQCILQWRRQLKAKGNLKDTRGKHGKGGRNPKEKIPKDEKERIKYLEAKIAYLEAENDFLEKLRKKS